MSSVPASLYHDLPRPLTSLVGREREIARVCHLLGQPDVRLVTLTGPGGVGKTRLAIAVADVLRASFPDGIAFISLQDISNPDLVEVTVAGKLGAYDTSGRSLRDGIVATIGSRALLLMLDNFEHVLPSAALISDLLQACSELRVLVTSRTVLNLHGEHDHAVPPLQLPAGTRQPALTELKKVAAVELFVSRAQMADDAFLLTEANAAAIVEICERLEGLPLAIELAAARSRLLPPAALLGRLEQRLPLLVGGPRDAPSRQHTIRNTIDWSFALLTHDQQRLFRQLSVFAGGWTVESAEAVCDEDLDVLEGLGALIDQSMVYQTGQPEETTRFGMLETLREYAAGQLDNRREEAGVIRGRHVAYFVEFVDPFDVLEGNIPEANALTAWEADVRREQANFRVALAWAQSHDPHAMLQVVACLGYFWGRYGQWSEGRRWLEIALSTKHEPSIALQNALYHLSWIMSFQGHAREAIPVAQECLDVARELKSPQGLTFGLTALARVWDLSGEYDIAIPLYEEAASLARSHDVITELPTILGNLGWIAVLRGDLDWAEQLLREAYELAFRLGWYDAATIWLHSLGGLALQRENAGDARLMLTESLETSVRVDAKMRVVENLQSFAGVAVLERRPEVAAQLLGFCEAERERLGFPIYFDERAIQSHIVDSARELLGDGPYASAFATGRRLTSDEAVKLALAGDSSTAPVVEPVSILSPREIDVVRLLADGQTNQEIAATLFISQHTVANHVASILNKLGLESRTAVATWAVRQRIV